MPNNEKPEQWADDLFREAMDSGAGPALTIQRAFTERTADLVADNAKLREALKPFAEKLTITELLNDPTPPPWAELSIEDRINVMAENKAKHDGEILAARQALAQQDTTDGK